MKQLTILRVDSKNKSISGVLVDTETGRKESFSVRDKKGIIVERQKVKDGKPMFEVKKKKVKGVDTVISKTAIMETAQVSPDKLELSEKLGDYKDSFDSVVEELFSIVEGMFNERIVVEQPEAIVMESENTNSLEEESVNEESLETEESKEDEASPEGSEE